MTSLVQPNAWVCLRLPSGTLKVLQIVPNTTVSLGKYGSFASNLIISRPYNLTYELLDRNPGEKDSGVRIVPASELHADTIAEENAAANPNGPDDKITLGGDGVEFQLVGENGEVIMRSNRETIDDAARQTMTMDEIEELKREGTGAGKDLIAKLMASHLGIEQKTAFSLAKYKLLKTKKYLRRFTILPMDVPMLVTWMMEEKDAGKILEIRQELLALIGCWANVHFAEALSVEGSAEAEIPTDVDGIARVPDQNKDSIVSSNSQSLIGNESSASSIPSVSMDLVTAEASTVPSTPPDTLGGRWLVVDETGGLLVAAMAERMGILHAREAHIPNPSTTLVASTSPDSIDPSSRYPDPPLAQTNTLTLVHQNAQPNLALLNYFSFDPNTPSSHPLTTHLHPISWLQLLHPELDTTFSLPPPDLTSSELLAMKSGKRGTHYRKLRRYKRVTNIVSSVQSGQFSGLAIASTMDPITVLRPLIPLLSGGSPISVYSPTIEPLTLLQDMYSTSRRTAFIQAPPASFLALPISERDKWEGDEDFPLNPTLLLNMSVQSSRVREWQVLPGRTHPVMTGKGGAEGYLFTAVRVIPKGDGVMARGKWGRKKEKGKELKDGKEEEEKDGEKRKFGDGEELKSEGVDVPEDAPSPSKKRRVDEL